MSVIKIRDEETGEVVEHEECESCNGLGGEDWSKDIETYSDWHECEVCEGQGYIDIGQNDQDIFVPERDALTLDD